MMSPNGDIMLIRDANDIGGLIRSERRRRKLSQQALASQAGVGRQWLVEVEKGKPRAEIGLILKLLETLDLRLSINTPAPAASPAAVRPRIDLDALIDRHRAR